MIISVLSSVIIWGAILLIALRILAHSGVCFPQNRFFSFALADRSLQNTHTASSRETAAVFGLSLSFRVIVFLISICAIYIFSENVNGFDGILNEYMKWDANNYVRIATGGYSYHVENGAYTTLAFFPLYPFLMRLAGGIFQNLQFSGLILSFLLYSGACAFFYRLFCMDYSKTTATRAIIYLSVFPHALFFGTLMNESMLLFTMAATLYFIRKHNWKWVGIFGAAAALSRMAGILLAIPAAAEWFEHYEIARKLKNKNIKEVWRLFCRKGLWIFLMLLGTGIYLLCNYKVTGNFFKFLEYQKTIWNNGSEYFGTCIAMIFKNAFTPSISNKFTIWIPEMLSIIFVTAALLYGIRRNRSMYSVLLAAYIIINAGFKWPISVARYMTCAVPAFLFLSDFSERHKWSEPLITASMAVGLGVYLTAYLTWKQIL